MNVLHFIDDAVYNDSPPFSTFAMEYLTNKQLFDYLYDLGFDHSPLLSSCLFFFFFTFLILWMSLKSNFSHFSSPFPEPIARGNWEMKEEEEKKCTEKSKWKYEFLSCKY